MNRLLFIWIFILSSLCISCSDSTNKKTGTEPKAKDLVSEDRDYNKYAPEIQSQLRYLDSLYGLGLFYFKYDGSLYYIPVIGEFKNPEQGKFVDKGDYKMGLLNAQMDTLLNFEYDKIGNPDAISKGWLEIEKDGKFGMYDLKNKRLIACEFDAIYPSDHSYEHPYVAKVKKGDRFGILSYEAESASDVLFAPDGYFNESVYFESPFANKEFLHWKFDVANTAWKPLLNLHEEYYEGDPVYARCIVLAPSYMEQARILEEYNEALMMEGDADFGYDLYKGEVALVEENNGILMRIVSFMQRFSESRGEIIETDRLISSDRYGNELGWEVLFEGHQEYDNCRNKKFRFIDSTLLEVCISQKSTYAAYDERDAFYYFKIHQDGHIEKLSSNRLFPFTEFVMMDTSYFQVCLFRQLHDSAYEYPSKGIHKVHYDLNDLNWMMAEIYADNGMKIPLKQWNDTFERFKWYRPKLEADDEKLDVTDRHNISLIRMRIEHMAGNEKFWTREEKIHAAFAP